MSNKSDYEYYTNSGKPWIEGFAGITFDTDQGQKIEFIYPENCLNSYEQNAIKFLAMPDCNNTKFGVTKYCFKLRNDDKIPYGSLSSSDHSFLYGFTYFKQQVNKQVSRGASQKSIALLTKLPFYTFFDKLIELCGESYFKNGIKSLFAIYHDICKWPFPTVKEGLLLYVANTTIPITIPNDVTTVKILKEYEQILSKKSHKDMNSNLEKNIPNQSVNDIKMKRSYSLSTITPSEACTRPLHSPTLNSISDSSSSRHSLSRVRSLTSTSNPSSFTFSQEKSTLSTDDSNTHSLSTMSHDSSSMLPPPEVVSIPTPISPIHSVPNTIQSSHVIIPLRTRKQSSPAITFNASSSSISKQAASTVASAPSSRASTPNRINIAFKGQNSSITSSESTLSSVPSVYRPHMLYSTSRLSKPRRSSPLISLPVTTYSQTNLNNDSSESFILPENISENSYSSNISEKMHSISVSPNSKTFSTNGKHISPNSSTLSTNGKHISPNSNTFSTNGKHISPNSKNISPPFSSSLAPFSTSSPLTISHTFNHSLSSPYIEKDSLSLQTSLNSVPYLTVSSEEENDTESPPFYLQEPYKQSSSSSPDSQFQTYTSSVSNKQVGTIKYMSSLSNSRSQSPLITTKQMVDFTSRTIESPRNSEFIPSESDIIENDFKLYDSTNGQLPSNIWLSPSLLPSPSQNHENLDNFTIENLLTHSLTSSVPGSPTQLLLSPPAEPMNSLSLEEAPLSDSHMIHSKSPQVNSYLDNSMYSLTSDLGDSMGYSKVDLSVSSGSSEEYINLENRPNMNNNNNMNSNTIVNNMSFQGIFQDIPLFHFFHNKYNMYEKLYEICLLNEPLIILSNYIDIASYAVLIISSLSNKIPYTGDCRPYFTLFDPDYTSIYSIYNSAFHDKTATFPGIIMGITNPYILQCFDYIPNILYIPSYDTDSFHIIQIPSSRSALPYINTIDINSKHNTTGFFIYRTKDIYIEERDVHIIGTEKECNIQELMSCKYTTKDSIYNDQCSYYLRCFFKTLTDIFLEPLNDCIHTATNNGIQFKPYDDINKIIYIQTNKEILHQIDNYMYSHPRHLFNDNYKSIYTKFLGTYNYKLYAINQRQETLQSFLPIFSYLKSSVTPEDFIRDLPSNQNEKISLLSRIYQALETEEESLYTLFPTQSDSTNSQNSSYKSSDSIHLGTRKSQELTVERLQRFMNMKMHYRIVYSSIPETIQQSLGEKYKHFLN